MAKGKKGKGKKGSKAIPILLAVPAALPAIRAYSDVGLTTKLPAQMLMYYTGVNSAGQWDSSFVKQAAIPILVGAIGHKVANRLGVNRQVKKLTMGWLQL